MYVLTIQEILKTKQKTYNKMTNDKFMYVDLFIFRCLTIKHAICKGLSTYLCNFKIYDPFQCQKFYKTNETQTNNTNNKQ